MIVKNTAFYSFLYKKEYTIEKKQQKKSDNFSRFKVDTSDMLKKNSPNPYEKRDKWNKKFYPHM